MFKAPSSNAKNFFGSGGLVVACDQLAQLTGGVRATELVNLKSQIPNSIFQNRIATKANLKVRSLKSSLRSSLKFNFKFQVSALPHGRATASNPKLEN